MDKIQIEHAPRKEILEEKGVFSWPIWEKEASEFPWHYDERETCYILEGEAEIESSEGERTIIKVGDLVVFLAGLDCTWKITAPIKKHYNFA